MREMILVYLYHLELQPSKQEIEAEGAEAD
jgi:hypothetical protein